MSSATSSVASNGAPCAWRARSQFVTVHRDSVRELGPAGAIIFELIVFRNDLHTDGWAATHELISEETGIPKRTVERTTSKLRERGFIRGERISRDNSTRVWAPVWAPNQSGDPETAVVAVPEAADEAASPETANVAVSSTKNAEEELQELSAEREVARLCELLATALRKVGCKRPVITKAWRREAAALLAEGRSLAEASVVIDFATTDRFWAGKVMTPRALRKHYDMLRMQSRRHSSAYDDVATWGERPTPVTQDAAQEIDHAAAIRDHARRSLASRAAAGPSDAEIAADRGVPVEGPRRLGA